MATHISGVNFRKLIADLADMYPFDIDEVILTELIANSLDSGATTIRIDYMPEKRCLVVQDNGKGMTASQFATYHDFAAELKTRGNGIGFAGVGAKISFNVADRVVSLTRSRSFCGGSDWHIDDKGQLSWDEIPAVSLPECGTRIEVMFRPDAEVSWVSTDDLIRALKRHYLPLTDPDFLQLYDSLQVYPASLRFIVNGTPLEPTSVSDAFGLEKTKAFTVRVRDHRIGFGILGVAAEDYPLAPGFCGVAVCTYGKVVKSELFGQFPGAIGSRIFGLVEVPRLVNFLTTSKADFYRRGMVRDFEEIYSSLRGTFQEWLREIGVETLELSVSDETRRLEREIQRLASEIHELAEFFGYPSGAIQVNLLREDDNGSSTAEQEAGGTITFPTSDGQDTDSEVGPTDRGAGDEITLAASDSGSLKVSPISRKSRRGPRIRFVDAPERDELAWVEGSIVVINTGHPAYVRVRSNGLARALLNMMAVGLAVQRFLLDCDRADPRFPDRMIKAWGRR